jgi:hypothetical protein
MQNISDKNILGMFMLNFCNVSKSLLRFGEHLVQFFIDVIIDYYYFSPQKYNFLRIL